MIVDCDTCRVRGPACSDCVVPVLLGLPGGDPAGAFGLGTTGAVALGVLAGCGLVPPLRLAPGPYHGAGAGSPREPGAAHAGRPGR